MQNVAVLMMMVGLAEFNQNSFQFSLLFQYDTDNTQFTPNIWRVLHFCTDSYNEQTCKLEFVWWPRLAGSYRQAYKVQQQGKSVTDCAELSSTNDYTFMTSNMQQKKSRANNILISDSVQFVQQGYKRSKWKSLMFMLWLGLPLGWTYMTARDASLAYNSSHRPTNSVHSEMPT